MLTFSGHEKVFPFETPAEHLLKHFKMPLLYNIPDGN